MYYYEESVAAYLKDVRKFKPLSAETEQELATLIQEEIVSITALKKLVKKSAEKLTQEERDFLIKTAEESPVISLAIKKLVEANTLFAVYEAFKFRGRRIPDGELVGLANEGLVIAAIKFEPNKNTIFISFAVHWIRQVILKALAEEKIVRPPVNIVDGASRLAKCDKQLTQSLGRHPLKKEIQDELDIDEEEYDRLRAQQQSQSSLDVPIFDGNNEILWRDMVEDKELRPDETAERKELSDILDEIMEKCLTEREQRVIKLQFGLINLENPTPQIVRREMRYGKSVTLEEVGKQLGVTRERARQITNIAMKKLRAGFKRRHLDLASLV